MKMRLRRMETGFTAVTFGLRGDSAEDSLAGSLLVLDRDEWIELGSPDVIDVTVR